MKASPEFDEELLRHAQQARLQAYAPYSGFAVGAAVRLADGSVITGANFENASLGLSLCAETVAIASANSAGKLADMVGLAVVGGRQQPEQDASAIPLTPCGRCRQILSEAVLLAGRDIPVYCADISGVHRTVYRSSELLPHAFSPAALPGGKHDNEG